MAKSYEEKSQYASNVVDMHLHEENPLRLLHSFHIKDGMIAKEIGYEIWRRDE